ncbi:Transmembrane inner ear expressed protein [Sarcoptes scabiei]|uniref:Transmembrane inner ear expressed protein n=1 Tax=Sarcoptes scabiei TaxID=52283 RepID=A0A834REJ1_SARSC|nr:Transmembrane inner ear expressed protein [Sarcoptes scabiei]
MYLSMYRKECRNFFKNSPPTTITNQLIRDDSIFKRSIVDKNCFEINHSLAIYKTLIPSDRFVSNWIEMIKIVAILLMLFDFILFGKQLPLPSSDREDERPPRKLFKSSSSSTITTSTTTPISVLSTQRSTPPPIVVCQSPIDLTVDSSWLETVVLGDFRIWHIIFSGLGILISIAVVLCCLFRCRIPRTKQEIEADYTRKKITKLINTHLRKIRLDELEFDPANLLPVLKRVEDLEENRVQKHRSFDTKRLSWRRRLKQFLLRKELSDDDDQINDNLKENQGIKMTKEEMDRVEKEVEMAKIDSTAFNVITDQISILNYFETEKTRKKRLKKEEKERKKREKKEQKEKKKELKKQMKEQNYYEQHRKSLAMLQSTRPLQELKASTLESDFGQKETKSKPITDNQIDAKLTNDDDDGGDGDVVVEKKDQIESKIDDDEHLQDLTESSKRSDEISTIPIPTTGGDRNKLIENETTEFVTKRASSVSPRFSFRNTVMSLVSGFRFSSASNRSTAMAKSSTTSQSPSPDSMSKLLQKSATKTDQRSSPTQSKTTKTPTPPPLPPLSLPPSSTPSSTPPVRDEMVINIGLVNRQSSSKKEQREKSSSKFLRRNKSKDQQTKEDFDRKKQKDLIKPLKIADQDRSSYLDKMPQIEVQIERDEDEKDDDCDDNQKKSKRTFRLNRKLIKSSQDRNHLQIPELYHLDQRTKQKLRKTKENIELYRDKYRTDEENKFSWETHSDDELIDDDQEKKRRRISVKTKKEADKIDDVKIGKIIKNVTSFEANEEEKKRKFSKKDRKRLRRSKTSIDKDDDDDDNDDDDDEIDDKNVNDGNKTDQIRSKSTKISSAGKIIKIKQEQEPESKPSDEIARDSRKFDLQSDSSQTIRNKRQANKGESVSSRTKGLKKSSAIDRNDGVNSLSPTKLNDKKTARIEEPKKEISLPVEDVYTEESTRPSSLASRVSNLVPIEVHHHHHRSPQKSPTISSSTITKALRKDKIEPIEIVATLPSVEQMVSRERYEAKSPDGDQYRRLIIEKTRNIRFDPKLIQTKRDHGSVLKQSEQQSKQQQRKEEDQDESNEKDESKDDSFSLKPQRNNEITQ